jgi:para-aminobenzoate synthetase/4-amino-4-deoxychorismate lyase
MNADKSIPLNSVLLRADRREGDAAWLLFRSPLSVISTSRIDDVLLCLADVESAVARGYHAAGFISYEAAPAFDSALTTRPPGELPLLWFGVYDRPDPIDQLPAASHGDLPAISWRPEMDEPAYRSAVEAIKSYIADGHTYQVNLTQRLHARGSLDPYALFCSLYRAQPVPYAACFDAGRHAVCSLSPELFFYLRGRRIISRPMKGTAPRGRWWQEDQDHARNLADSPKDRAENAMIVDMIRNDLGRIAEQGSVEVEQVFTIERYRTLFQMTSTVSARTDASVSEILRALFPCASVTGAPKVRTMQIIRELELSPRGVYTGCVGYIAPSREALFNVAIRTAVVDRQTGRIEYGTGGGITWDSVASAESRECRLKASVLDCLWPEFSLLETILWDGGKYRLLDGHLRRIERSAEYFGYLFDRRETAGRLAEAAAGFETRPRRVRLLVDERGGITIESRPFERSRPRATWRVALARHPVDSTSPFLYHKTTHRTVYDEARADSPGVDDVVLWNERGELTESTIANVVVRFGEHLVTPPIEAGLLAGVFRERLLDRGVIREQRIPVESLASATAIYLANSVRGWIPVRLFDPHGLMRADAAADDRIPSHEEAPTEPVSLDPRGSAGHAGGTGVAEDSGRP